MRATARCSSFTESGPLEPRFYCGVVSPDPSSVRRALPSTPDAFGGEIRDLGGELRLASHGDLRVSVASQGGTVAVVSARWEERSTLTERLELSPEANDGEVLLAGYRRWGEELPLHLSGDFAWALWEPSQRQLLCAVDPLGLGVLFVTWSARGELAFGSHIAPLRRWRPEGAELEEGAVARYLSRCPSEPSATSFRGIERVAPGTLVALHPDGTRRVRRYWSPERLYTFPSRPSDEIFGLLRDRLQRAVHARLGRGTVAIAQSGGLDSSSILCFAARTEAKADLRPLYVRPEEPSCDEAPALRCLSSYTGVPIRTLAPATDLRALRQLGTASGEPRYLDYFPVVGGVLQGALEAGAQRLLTGLYGDFAGGSVTLSAWLVSLLRAGRFEEWWRDRARAPSRSKALLASAARALPLLERKLRPRRAQKHRRGWFPDVCLRAEAVRRLGLDDELRARALELERTYTDADFGRRLWLELLRPEETEPMNRAALAAGIEAAHPFADLAVLEASLGIPAHLLRRDGLGRYPLRAALAGVLPESIRTQRRKVTFHDFYARVFERGIPELARRPLAPRLQDLVCGEKVGTLVRQGRWSYPEGAHLWRCLAVSDWLWEHGIAG